MVYIFLVDEQNGSQTIEESGLNVKQELSATVNGEKVQMIQLEKLIE